MGLLWVLLSWVPFFVMRGMVYIWVCEVVLLLKDFCVYAGYLSYLTFE
jgi:hypothetical protein